MTRENWIKHIEQTENIIRPSRGGNDNLWIEAVRKHQKNDCGSCMAREKTRNANIYRKQRERVMLDCGLTKYRHPLTGSVCWE